MAKFRTHISWGVLVGVFLVVTGLIFSIFSGLESVIWIFLFVLIGSFLPDLDLDDGIPFQIIFGLLGVGSAGLVFLNFYQSGERDWKTLGFVSLLTFIFIRFVLGSVFKKFTRHRGMFHSIPSAILFGLITIWLLHIFSILEGKELIIGGAVAIGYIGHLILDEIYSTVDLTGRSFLPKRSLGSALKFYSNSKIATFLFYLLIFIFILTLPETKIFIE